MRIVTVPTAAPRDRHRAAIRLLRFDQFPGLPVPGELVALRWPGVVRTTPGEVSYVHYGDKIVGVEPERHLAAR